MPDSRMNLIHIKFPDGVILPEHIRVQRCELVTSPISQEVTEGHFFWDPPDPIKDKQAADFLNALYGGEENEVAAVLAKRQEMLDTKTKALAKAETQIVRIFK